MRLSDLPRGAALLALWLQAALGHAPADAGQGPRVESSRHGDVIEIRAEADLAADRDTAWRVLTDYGAYSAFIPGLSESRILSRNGTSVIVEQAGTAALGPLHIPMEITFRIEESPPDEIESHAVAGSLRSLESRYTLTARDHESGLQLRYTGHLRPGFPLFGRVGQSAVEEYIARQFRALVDEIERQYRAEPLPSTETRK